MAEVAARVELKGRFGSHRDGHRAAQSGPGSSEFRRNKAAIRDMASKPTGLNQCTGLRNNGRASNKASMMGHSGT